MPELPEVETVVRDLIDAALPGCAILSASVYWPRTISGCTPRQFQTRMRGVRIRHIHRRGKYIVLLLTGDFDLLIHLRMTGQLAFSDAGSPRARHQHVVLVLDDGRELRFRDPRKFGRWYLVRDTDERLAELGPEPLVMTARELTRSLAAHSRMLKPLLLDQRVIAGLGNIYVDEALWDAALHPCRLSDSLAGEDAARLHKAVRKVLRRGLRAMGTTLGNGSTNFYSVGGRRGRNKDGLKVFRRTGEACPRCGTAIVRLLIAQRGTHICPSCQRCPGDRLKAARHTRFAPKKSLKVAPFLPEPAS